MNDEANHYVAAVILAAGQGQRLGGRPKAALRIGAKSVLERLINAIRDAGVPTVSVVVGPHKEHLLPLIDTCGAFALQHTAHEAPLVVSQRLALEGHTSRNKGFDLMITLADLPFLSSQDIQEMLQAWRIRAPTVEALMPEVEGVRGHPVILSWNAVQAIQDMPGHLGIRDWIASHSEASQRFRSNSTAYVTDLDTPADLALLRSRVEPELVSWPPSLSDHPV